MKLNKLTIDYNLFKDKLNALNDEIFAVTDEQQVLPILAVHQILKECEVKSRRGTKKEVRGDTE